MTVEEAKKVLSETIAENLEVFEPLVIVNPEDILPVEDCITLPFQMIDLAKTKAGDIAEYLDKISSGKYSAVFFKNIDRIKTRKDRHDWEKLISFGLESKNITFVYEDADACCGLKEYHVQFSQIWVICSCAEVPAFIKEKRCLGFGISDFSNN